MIETAKQAAQCAAVFVLAILLAWLLVFHPSWLYILVFVTATALLGLFLAWVSET